MDGAGFAKGLGTAIIMIAVVAFVVGGLPTFFVTKHIYYKKGYRQGVRDALVSKAVRIDFDTTIQIKVKEVDDNGR